jgi:hypothetical protein
MSGGALRRPWLLVAAILTVGLAGTVLALRNRESNTQLIAAQQGLLPVSPTALEQLILTTSDPRPGYGGRAVSARCTTATATATTTALGAAWVCAVRYPRPPRIDFRVRVRGDRSIYGLGRPAGVASYRTPLTVSGCCVGAP